MKAVFATLLTIALATPASADWYEASTDHFVIYADDSEKDVREFAESLERYHSALEYVTGRDLPTPSPSNRVTIFAVGGERTMKKLAGDSDVAGFYSPRAGASKAFVQNIRMRSGYPSFSTVILLHEYAHHFLISSSRYAMPLWMSEGAAEFFAATTFEKDGSILIGRPAQHRTGDLAISRDMKIDELLDPFASKKAKGRLHAGFYGRAWLLYHYLTFEQERAGQLTNYWVNTANGKSSMDAAREAFGDLGKLEGELKSYLTRRQMYQFNLPAEKLTTGPIRLRELPEGEAKMMPIRIRSQRGVDSTTAPEVLADAREVAARYPTDPGVLTALAEAEFDAGNDKEAIAAADAALAQNPALANAYIQKGYALFRIADAAEDKDAAFTAAMQPFSQLNKLENDHPLPLVFYYRNYMARGAEPTETAKHAIERAAELAPFDSGLWIQTAMMQAGEGKIDLAKSSLRPVANAPHGGGDTNVAKVLLAMLDQAEEGTALAIGPALVEALESAATAESGD